MQEVLTKDSISRGDTNTTTAKPVTAISQRAAYVSFAAAAIFLVLLAALHIIKPEFDPSWRFVSEYAIGVLISRSLVRNQAWSSSRRLLLWTAHLTWISVVLMFASMFIMLGQTQGKFGPEVLIGWPNRLVVLAYCVWLMVVAGRASQLSTLEIH